MGAFVTAMPTLGAGFLVFAVLLYVSERVSPAALLAAVVVFNPAVKWGVYVGSFALGSLLLGPVPGVTARGASPSAGSAVVVRLLVGNTIVAVLAAVVGYAAVYRLAVRYGDSPVVASAAEAVEEVAGEVLAPPEG